VHRRNTADVAVFLGRWHAVWGGDHPPSPPTDSPLVYFIIRYLQSYKYILFGQPYCYFRLLVVVRIIWRTFFELATVENQRFSVRISTLSIIVPWDMSTCTSGLGGHILFPVVIAVISRGTFFLLVTVENPRFAVGISTLSTLVPKI